MNKGFIYEGTVESDLAPNREYIVRIVYRGHDQAAFALAQHFRVDPSAVKIKAQRGADGKPIEVFMPAGDASGEQCWADLNGVDRCGNSARIGFHTCKIHTAYDAPAPFGTPEYERWIESDGDEIDPKPKSSKSRARTRKTPPKPAKSISRARRNRDKA